MASQLDTRTDRPGQVSLPSIQEMFPDYMLRRAAYPTAGSVCMLDGDRGSFNVPNKLSPVLSPPLYTTTHTQRTKELGRSYHRKRSSFHDPPSPSRTTHLESYSFDILRPDPSTCSLEHVAHSNTFRNRGCILSPQISSLGMVNGSAPVFKVTPSLHVAVPVVHQETVSGIAGRTSSASPSGANNMLPGYSSVITFPASGAAMDTTPEMRRSIVIGGDDAYPHEKGKKHKCHICSKRFNRPSSLRIHVNTHTGATPFRCPHPTCGREFNVNSNMRRHYRNHSLPGLFRSNQDQPQQRTPAGGHSDTADAQMASTGTANLSEDSGEDMEGCVGLGGCYKSDVGTDSWNDRSRRPCRRGQDEDSDSSESKSSSASPTTPGLLSIPLPCKLYQTKCSPL